MVLGELRQGALEGVMADAIAQAYGVAPSSVRRAAMLSGDLRQAALAARAHGEAGLSEFKFRLSRPLQPMLAQTAADPTDALARLGMPRSSSSWTERGFRCTATSARCGSIRGNKTR